MPQNPVSITTPEFMIFHCIGHMHVCTSILGMIVQLKDFEEPTILNADSLEMILLRRQASLVEHFAASMINAFLSFAAEIFN